MELKKLILSFIIFIISPAVFAKYPDPVSAKHGMVVTEQYLASEVGAAILKQGGNAVDAAVAVGYALAVVSPCCGNIGVVGFMLSHLTTGKDIFINFREKAPLAATTNMFLDNMAILSEKVPMVTQPSVCTRHGFRFGYSIAALWHDESTTSDGTSDSLSRKRLCFVCGRCKNFTNEQKIFTASECGS